MWKYVKQRSSVIGVTLLVCLSVIAAGTFAWFTLVQNLRNEFTFEPYGVKLIKVSSADSDLRLAGAEFALYDESGQELGRYFTDANGEITLDALDPEKSYYFQEISAPYGFQIVGDGKTALFHPDLEEIVVENLPILSSLTIVKRIGETCLDGSTYDINAPENAGDKKLPFAFTVTIGEKAGTLYPYAITNEDGTEIGPYSYTYEDGTAMHQTGSGTIPSGGTLYLRHGERAVIEGIPAGTDYQVREQNYFSYDDPGFTAENAFDNPGGYGCEDAATPGHDRVLTTAGGWAADGSNTGGVVREEGSVAVFENRKVPKDYEITISSLAVVDRILANPEDVDYSKGFEVTVELGDAADHLAYFYEVVHLPDTAEKLGSQYQFEYDYYDRNDPGVPGQLAEQPEVPPDADHFYDYSLAPPAHGEEPGSKTSSDRWSLPEIPTSYAAASLWLHRPTERERWPQQDGTYGALRLSSDPQDNPKGTHNKIVVELHHGSAVIIYGVPVGTAYTVSQVDYRLIDGYLIDSTHKDTGVVLPDLDVDPDPDTADPSLLRVRADIYNYFVRPIMRKITVEKHWEHGDNDPALYPTDTIIQVYDPETKYVYDSRTYRSVDEWAEAEVPKYRPGTHELIDYAVSENPPPSYVITDITETEDGFRLTNTYAPATVKPSVQKTVLGADPPAENFVFELKALTANAPMPAKTTAVVRGAGTGFFSGIRFEPVGTDGRRSYRYQVRELPGTAAGYTYDGAVYFMEVTVEERAGVVQVLQTEYRDKGTGRTVSAPLPFVNRYRDVVRASLTVKKTVTGNDADPSKQFSFRVDIDGYPTRYLQLRGGESATIDGLPVGTHYTVTESSYSDEGYTTTSTGSSGTIPRSGAVASFTNTKEHSSPGLGRLTLQKQVEGAGADAAKEFRFVVQIGRDRYVVYLRGGETWTSPPHSAGTSYSVVEDSYAAQGYHTTSTGASGTISSRGSTAQFVNRKTEAEKADLTVVKVLEGNDAEPNRRFAFTVTIGERTYRIALSGGERYTFYDIPVGTAFHVVEDDYSANGYVTSSTGGAGTIAAAGSTATFTNRRDAAPPPGETGRLTVTKTVAGTFIDPTKEFHFTVLVGGETQEFFLRHGESRTFENIPAGTVYSVMEDDYASEGYETRSTGASGTMTAAGATAAFLNEYQGGTPPPPSEGCIQLSGTKTWVHGDNPASARPSSVVVYVMDGSTIVTQKTVTAADNWAYAFNLPQYDQSGAEIVYSINEEAVKGYNKSIQGYDLTNTYTPGAPQTGDPNRMWVWFWWLAVGAMGLRVAVFYRGKRRLQS